MQRAAQEGPRAALRLITGGADTTSEPEIDVLAEAAAAFAGFASRLRADCEWRAFFHRTSLALAEELPPDARPSYRDHDQAPR